VEPKTLFVKLYTEKSGSAQALPQLRTSIFHNTITDDTSFVLPWGGSYATRQELVDHIGERFAENFVESFRQTSAGWQLAVDLRDMLASQALLNDDLWEDWLATCCPARLVRGSDSKSTSAAQL
jgi:hypothetical protein